MTGVDPCPPALSRRGERPKIARTFWSATLRIVVLLILAGPILPPGSATAATVTVTEAQGPVQPKSGCLQRGEAACGLRMYQVMVEAFVDGDPDHDYGDGYGTSHHRGDLRGITQSLDYIAGLGMNAIWLTPIFDSDAGAPQERLVGAGTDLKLDATGYFTRNYFAVDPRFGTLDDLRELVREAHARDLRILLDGVFGHHKGGLVPSPSGRLPVDSTDPADYGGDPAGYPGRVVDFDAPESLEFYREVATWWIRETGIDGWRLDQAYQVPLSAWREIEAAVRAEAARQPGNPGYLVAEIFGSAEQIRDDALGPPDDPALDSAFDFPVRWALVGVLAGEENGTARRPPSVIDEPWAFGAHTATYRDDALPNLMLGNHDFVRFGDLLQRAAIANPEDDLYWARHRLAFLFQGAYSGPLTRYYGEELGDELPGFAARVTVDCANRGLCDDHVARTSGKVPGVSVPEAGLTDEQRELLEHHRQVMQARQQLPALSHGARQHLHSDHRIYADLKRYAGQEVVFAMNVTDEAHTLRLATSLFDSAPTSAWDVLGEAPVVPGDGHLDIDLPPQSGRYVLLQDGPPAGFSINAGLNDAWYDPDTSGQGVFVTVLPELRQLFVAWFTFDTEDNGASAILGAPEHRWFVALGPYQGNLAELNLSVTSGGVFDARFPRPESVDGGRLQLEFHGCNELEIHYELAQGPVTGQLRLQRVVNDNLSLCETLR